MKRLYIEQLQYIIIFSGLYGIPRNLEKKMPGTTLSHSLHTTSLLNTIMKIVMFLDQKKGTSFDVPLL